MNRLAPKTIQVNGREHEVTFTVTAECNDCGEKARAATPEGAANLIKHGKHYDELSRAERIALLGQS